MSEYDKVWAILMENAKQLSELKNYNEQSAKRFAQEMAELKARQARTDAQIAKTGRQIKSINKRIGDYINSESKKLEKRFTRIFTQNMKINNIQYDFIQPNFVISNRKVTAEIDILLKNGDHLLLIEVKNKARPADFKQLKRQAKIMQIIYPDFNNIHLGLASTSFDQQIIDQAKKDSVILCLEQAGQLELILPDA